MIRSRVVYRAPDGGTIRVIAGPSLYWQYDRATQTYFYTTKDGALYAVQHTNPGNGEYRYWAARVKIDGEVVNLGDEYMIAFEGKEVCQIYEAARNSKSEKLDDPRGPSEGEHSPRVGRVRRILSHAGPDGSGSSGR